MASLLANGISTFFPQSSSEIHSSPSGFFFLKLKSSSNYVKIPHTFRFSKVRAADIISQPAGAIVVDSPGKKSSTVVAKDADPFQKFLNRDYKWGFNLEIDSFSIPKGLSEETVKLISLTKGEPDWMLDYRLKSFRKFISLKEPKWSDNLYPEIDFQDMCYYSEPKKKPTLNSLYEAGDELLMHYEKLGVPINERNNIAVDAVLDSVSIATTRPKTLEESGVIFCSISEAIREYPDLVKSYLGRVVTPDDNFYAALNSAVFSDGSFVYIPKNVRCPTQISTYFRINAKETGQFERTLIVADEGSFVGYLEGCFSLPNTPLYDRYNL